jgi:hypothetical protein
MQCNFVTRDLALLLAQGFTQYVLVHTSTRTASGQLAVNYDRRYAADAMLCGPAGNIFLVHVMDNDLVLSCGQLLDSCNRVFAGLATRAKDLNFVPHLKYSFPSVV